MIVVFATPIFRRESSVKDRQERIESGFGKVARVVVPAMAIKLADRLHLQRRQFKVEHR